MSQSLFIFVIGLGGVFLGMACLYTAIRITAFVVGQWAGSEDQTGG